MPRPPHRDQVSERGWWEAMWSIPSDPQDLLFLGICLISEERKPKGQLSGLGLHPAPLANDQG